MKRVTITISLVFTFIILYSNNPISTEKKESKQKDSITSSLNSRFDNNYIYPDRGFFISTSPGLSNIKNNNISTEYWSQNRRLGYTVNVGYFRSFNKWFKLKTGIGITGYSTSLTANGEINPHEFKDIDNDTYIEQLTLINVENHARPMYLSVPFMVEYGNTNIHKIGFYLDFGMKHSILINEAYELNGMYSTKGKYDKWGITLEEVPELGFYTSKKLESTANFKKYNFSLLGGAGISIPLSGFIMLKAGFVGILGFSDIAKKLPMETDVSPITLDIYNFRSRYIDNTLAITKESKTSHIGIEFGLYINKLVK